jgi:hypothetical protein
MLSIATVVRAAWLQASADECMATLLHHAVSYLEGSNATSVLMPVRQEILLCVGVWKTV